MKRLFVPDAAPPAGTYCHAVIANGFVFVAGQGPRDPETGLIPDGFKDQVRQTIKNLQVILEGAGTDLAHVVKVNSYLTDLTRFKEYNEVYHEFFQHAPPVRTTVATALLGILVEIECVAVLPEQA